MCLAKAAPLLNQDFRFSGLSLTPLRCWQTCCSSEPRACSSQKHVQTCNAQRSVPEISSTWATCQLLGGKKLHQSGGNMVDPVWSHLNDPGRLRKKRLGVEPDCRGSHSARGPLMKRLVARKASAERLNDKSTRTMHDGLRELRVGTRIQRQPALDSKWPLLADRRLARKTNVDKPHSSKRGFAAHWKGSGLSPCKRAINYECRLFGRETRQCHTNPCAARGQREGVEQF